MDGTCNSDADSERGPAAPSSPQTPHARPSQPTNQDGVEMSTHTSQETQEGVDKPTPGAHTSGDPGLNTAPTHTLVCVLFITSKVLKGQYT